MVPHNLDESHAVGLLQVLNEIMYKGFSQDMSVNVSYKVPYLA